MSKTQTFIAQVVDGRVLPEEIDDFIDQWHDGDGDETLAAFLGMSEEQYDMWVKDPSLLNIIIAIHADPDAVSRAINDNEMEFEHQMAARANAKVDARALVAWLKAEKYI
jgi:hypothetical protein